MLLTALAALSAILATPALSKPQRNTPRVEAEHYSLKNGLKVILHQDDRLPTVAVEVRYLVGSAHEVAGKTGFAHLFEHLMFNGSKHYPDDYFGPFEPVGAKVNGTTNLDRTNYFEQLPRGYLDLALWMESDRMENLLPAMTQEKLDNQREVVKNERRMRYENRPYGRSRMVILENLFPTGHPYHHPTIGSHEDLEAASLDDVKAFFEQYYAPANAVLTIAGDFDMKQTKALVKRYFARIAPGRRAASPEFPALARPIGDSSSPVVVEDSVAQARVYLAWPSPALYDDGDAALDIASSILSEGPSSRLEKRLVHELKVAKDVDSYQASNLGPSYFVIQATAAPGVSTQKLRNALHEALSDARAKRVKPDELAEAIAGWEKSFFHRTQSPLSKALMLSGYYHATGSPNYFSLDLARYQTLKTTQIDHALDQYLNPKTALEIHFVPAGASSPKGESTEQSS